MDPPDQPTRPPTTSQVLFPPDTEDAPAPAANAARSSRARGSRSGASGHTTPAGSDRTDERFFLRHNSAKGVRPFKLTDDMKSIIFGGASALPDWVSQDNNERGSHYRASRPSRNQTEPDTRGVNVSPTPTDAQQEGADSGELRAWGFPLPQAARRSNAVSPLREEQQPDDANELEGGARSHANLQRVQRAAATRVEPTGVLARGAKMVGESLPMMVMGLFYKMTVPPEPMRLQAPSDPQVREKALVQGVAITSLFTEIQQRNSHYLRLLLALIFVSFYFLVVYWQADVESKFAVASSVSQSFLVTLPLKIEEIGVFLRLAINSVWTDVNCGNGFCDAPYEFPQFGELGCQEDCGKETNLVNLLVVLEGDFSTSALGEMASEGLRASASWNLCFEDAKRAEYGLEDLCYFPEAQAFESTAVVISKEFSVPPTLNWYVHIVKDYYRTLEGRVYVLGNTTSVVDVEITPSWSSCSAQRA